MHLWKAWQGHWYRMGRHGIPWHGRARHVMVVSWLGMVWYGMIRAWVLVLALASVVRMVWYGWYGPEREY